MSEIDQPQTALASTSTDVPEADYYCGPPYVKLNDRYDKWLCWSSDPSELYLATYLDPNLPESLPNGFNIKGLCPVQR
jgi:hypothetical protein